MRYIVPITITDAMLVASSVAEADHAAWSAGTAYVVGNRVIRVATHSIYERLVDGTTATAPEADPINWVRVGPTNRWAALDGAIGTTTTDTASISFTIAPGTVVGGLALLGLDAESIAITATVSGDTIYARSFDPVSTEDDIATFYEFFFEQIRRRTTLVVTDLPAFEEMEITVTVTGAGSVSIGSLLLGTQYELGDTLADPTIGIIDYSVKQTDEFGATQVAERAWAKRMSLSVVLASNLVDIAAARLARVRAKPLVWIGSQDFETLIVYGFVKDWSIAIPGKVLSTCNLEIEGLV